MQLLLPLLILLLCERNAYKRMISLPLKVFLLFLVSYSCGEALPTVHGILNGSVYLSSGFKNKSVSLISWRVEGNKFIATFDGKTSNTNIESRYFNRLYLHINNGSLQINRLQMGDTLTYSVRIFYEDGLQESNEVKLVVHEKVNKPKLETIANFSTINTCNVSVICSTTQGFSASSDCDNRSGVFRCSESNVINSSIGTSITITSKGNTIVCNSSNLVSWDTDTIEQACQHGDNSTKSEERNNANNNSHSHKKYWFIGVLLFACLILYLGYKIWKVNETKQRKSPDRTKQKDSPESYDGMKQKNSLESDNGMKHKISPESDDGTKQNNSPESDDGMKQKNSLESDDGMKHEISPESDDGTKQKNSPESDNGMKQKNSLESDDGMKHEISPESDDGTKQKNSPESDNGMKQKNSLESDDGMKHEISPESDDGTKQKNSPESDNGMKQKNSLESDDGMKHEISPESDDGTKQKNSLESDDGMKHKNSPDSDDGTKQKDILESD